MLGRCTVLVFEMLALQSEDKQAISVSGSNMLTPRQAAGPRGVASPSGYHVTRLAAAPYVEYEHVYINNVIAVTGELGWVFG